MQVRNENENLRLHCLAAVSVPQVSAKTQHAAGEAHTLLCGSGSCETGPQGRAPYWVDEGVDSTFTEGPVENCTPKIHGAVMLHLAQYTISILLEMSHW